MEFDILNEILTGTVANLFTDLGRHKAYIRNSSQMGQDKSEIPRANSQSDLLQIISNGSDYSQSPGMGTKMNDGTMDPQVSNWLSSEAKSRLAEAF